MKSRAAFVNGWRQPGVHRTIQAVVSGSGQRFFRRSKAHKQAGGCVTQATVCYFFEVYLYLLYDAALLYTLYHHRRPPHRCCLFPLREKKQPAVER